MLDLDDINQTIAELEVGKTTFQNCEKLAALLTVRNHLMQKDGAEPLPAYSMASAPASEFLEAFTSAPVETALSVLDEHMNAIKVVAPREYAAVLRKLAEA